MGETSIKSSPAMNHLGVGENWGVFKLPGALLSRRGKGRLLVVSKKIQVGVLLNKEIGWVRKEGEHEKRGKGDGWGV